MIVGLHILFAVVTVCVGQSPTSNDSSGVPVEIRTVESDALKGRLVELGESTARVSIDGEIQQLPIESILQIKTDSPPSRNETNEESATCYLIGGGAVRGSIESNPPSGYVRLTIDRNQTLDIPLMAVAAIRFPGPTTTALSAAFEARRAERKPGRDLLLLLRDGDLSVAPGALETVSPSGWSFSFGGKSRNGPLAGAYGVILGSTAPAIQEARIEIAFGNDNRVNARSVTANTERVTIDAGPLGRFDVPWAGVRSIEFESRRVEQLSSLRPVVDHCKTIVGGTWPARKDLSVSGQPMRIGSLLYESGWGVHAASRLEFELGGRYDRFFADVGVDAAVAPRGSVVFRVLVDGEERFASDKMRGGDAARRVNVELNGASKLTLICDPADDLDLSDHGNWANAYLVRRQGADAP